MRDPPRLFETIRAAGVTLIELVPLVRRVCCSTRQASAPARSLPTLRCAMVTGEPVQPSLVNEWFERYPEVPLVNAYGPTEAADDICQAIVTGPLGRDG